jgi:hypothetical protein
MSTLFGAIFIALVVYFIGIVIGRIVWGSESNN